MAHFLWKKLLALLLTLLAAATLIFAVLHLLPGNAAQVLLGPDADPQAVAALATQLGLDAPAWPRFTGWLRGLLHGDLGRQLRLWRARGRFAAAAPAADRAAGPAGPGRKRPAGPAHGAVRRRLPGPLAGQAAHGQHPAGPGHSQLLAGHAADCGVCCAPAVGQRRGLSGLDAGFWRRPAARPAGADPAHAGAGGGANGHFGAAERARRCWSMWAQTLCAPPAPRGWAATESFGAMCCAMPWGRF